ncbi:MAG: FUSC family protein, partial [Burkholderiales bacterium]|nr:FUSC family protein [Burkholderiales bacterium]
ESGADGAATPSALLARALSGRVGHVESEVARMVALARGDIEPDLTLVRVVWQMFVSPADWSWRPLRKAWHWNAPPLRHALRAALAIGTGYLVSIALPWGSHAYWILLTIVVVLRGSLAQTLERRNSRVAGTLLGCALAAGLIMLHLPVPVLLVCSSIAQALAHAFAVRRYLIAAVGATVLGLLQAHQLDAAAPPVFAGLERLADTLIGVAIAWGFSYVLPAWERTQIPRLVQRTLAAQARHAQVALGLGQLDSVDNAPELEWRLARREAYDALSALVQATQRSLAEPRAVRPPLDPLARLLAHGYQLLAQLTAVKTMLLLRRGRLKLRALREPLRRSGDEIEARLAGRARAPAPAAEEVEYPHALPDPSVDDLSPWALRRLALAEAIAERLRADADEVFDATGRPRTRSYGGPG